MAKARSILKRAKAVKSTRTITKTMEMISTSRFKKTLDRVVAARPYTDRLSGIVGDLVRGGLQIGHPLLSGDDTIKRDVLIVITANRGLCGAYNSSVLRLAMERFEQLKAAGNDTQLYVVGKRGMQVLKFRGYTIAKSFTEFDFAPDYRKVSELAESLMTQFIGKEISGLEVAYTQFVSIGRQKPAIAQVLPLSVLPAPEHELEAKAAPRPTYEYLPSPEVVLTELLPAAVRLRLYQCFLDAAVSEQIARMTSMRAATENADEMIHSLTVQYNRMRQSQITTELAEIMGGRVGMEDE